jgi:hypothetical protein
MGARTPHASEVNAHRCMSMYAAAIATSRGQASWLEDETSAHALLNKHPNKAKVALLETACLVQWGPSIL